LFWNKTLSYGGKLEHCLRIDILSQEESDSKILQSIYFACPFIYSYWNSVAFLYSYKKTFEASLLTTNENMKSVKNCQLCLF